MAGRSVAPAVLAVLSLVVPAGGPATAQARPETVEAAAGEPYSAAGAKKHRKRQKRPIKMGVSGGSIEDFAVIPPNIACCGGTLGALLMKKGRYFVLSNNHVLARVNQAAPGEAINQPGLNDTKCEARAKNLIGTLSGFKKLKLTGSNTVDAAIAETTPEDVSADGAILGIGVPGNKVVAPRVGTAVVKSGRTTGVTRGEITTTNVSGFVSFPEECGSDVEHEVQFKKVFLVASTGPDPFSDGGDSGSVIYEDTGSCPRAVGHLFAGNEEFTAANPMKQVMKAVRRMKPKGKATLVGCQPVAAFDDRQPAAGDPAERRAMRVQRSIEQRILALPGVVGIGIGRASDRSGRVVFRVLVEDARPEIAASVPRSLDGVPVETVASGKLRALSCTGAGKARGGIATP